MTDFVITHATFFSGIGGPEIAAEQLGWINLFHCDNDPFCTTILKHHFPHAEHYNDITQTNFSIWQGRVYVLSGGFPCQPFSNAGKRKGQDDSRFLWPNFLRGIKEIQPTYVVAENVYGVLNQDQGIPFEQICTDLEAEGYEVQPILLPIAGIGKRHKRNRFFFVAYSHSNGRKAISRRLRGEQEKIQHTKRTRKESKRKHQEPNQLDTGGNVFLQFEKECSQPPIFAVDDGLPFELDGITVPTWMQESLKAAGNAICPGQIKPIFEVIDKMIRDEIR